MPILDYGAIFMMHRHSKILNCNEFDTCLGRQADYSPTEEQGGLVVENENYYFQFFKFFLHLIFVIQFRACEPPLRI